MKDTKIKKPVNAKAAKQTKKTFSLKSNHPSGVPLLSASSNFMTFGGGQSPYSLEPSTFLKGDGGGVTPTRPAEHRAPPVRFEQKGCFFFMTMWHTVQTALCGMPEVLHVMSPGASQHASFAVRSPEEIVAGG